MAELVLLENTSALDRSLLPNHFGMASLFPQKDRAITQLSTSAGLLIWIKKTVTTEAAGESSIIKYFHIDHKGLIIS